MSPTNFKTQCCKADINKDEYHKPMRLVIYHCSNCSQRVFPTGETYGPSPAQIRRNIKERGS